MTGLNDFDWFEQLHDPVQVNTRQQGDEWVRHLFQRISETTGCGGINFESLGPATHLYTLSDSTLKSSLLVHAGQDQPVCYIVGRGQKRTEDIEPWIEAVTYAVTLLGTTCVFSWWAIIGEDPEHRMTPPIQLTGPHTIGCIKLHPSHDLFFESHPREPMSSVHSWTFPVHAHGSNTEPDWSTASQKAVADLKVICSLLSLSSGRIWRLRQPPQPTSNTSAGQANEEVPKLPKYSPSFPDHLKHDDNYGDPTLFDVPEWVNGAWAKLQDDRELTQLVATYHESLLLEAQDHDSYALLSTVAIVEAIGKRTGNELSRCPKCKSFTGATERFRSALRRVMDHENAARLTKVVYEQRSRTAHDGALHGIEFIVGSHTGLNLMSDNQPVEFQGTVHLMRSVAAKLLRSELTSIQSH